MADKHTYDPATCIECGSPFMARRDSIKRGMGKYCTKSCQVKAQHKNGTNKAARQLSKHHNWKGGETIDAKGYRRILKPEHPHAFKDGYVMEHVVVACKVAGRLLNSDEVVHHKDENRLNNSEDNLQIMTRGEHTKLHAKLKRAST